MASHLDAKCKEMITILQFMQRVNDTGDDVTIEIASGINILMSMVSSLTDETPS